MFCNSCGKSIADDAQFCSQCGAVVGSRHAPRKLIRSRSDRRIAGVCGGLGEYLGVDTTVVRLIWFFVTFVSGIVPGILVYVLAWIIVPEEPASHHAVVSATQSTAPVASGG